MEMIRPSVRYRSIPDPTFAHRFGPLQHPVFLGSYPGYPDPKIELVNCCLLALENMVYSEFGGLVGVLIPKLPFWVSRPLLPVRPGALQGPVSSFRNIVTGSSM